MATDRTVPYHAFNFTVAIGGNPVAGGFSDVSGLTTELVQAEYRAGSYVENHVQKVQGLHKVGDVTLKRGVIDSTDFWAWIQDARVNGPKAKQSVTITLYDEARNKVQSWKLDKCFPLKYTAPTFAGKGGGDVAMEELVLSCEAFSIVPGGV